MGAHGLRLSADAGRRLDNHLLRVVSLLEEAKAVEAAERLHEDAELRSPGASAQFVITGRESNLETWVKALDTADAVVLAVGAAERYAGRSESFGVASACVKLLRDKVPPLDPDDVRLLLAFDDLPNIAHRSRIEVIGLALDRIERMLADELPEADSLA